MKRWRPVCGGCLVCALSAAAPVADAPAATPAKEALPRLVLCPVIRNDVFIK